MPDSHHMELAAEMVKEATPLRPTVGVVLGSGLGVFAHSLSQPTRIPYDKIPKMPLSTAVGHAGELVIGNIENSDEEPTAVAVLSGRFHLYEGYSAAEVVRGIRLFRALGVRTVILTCAAGGLNLDFSEGALVLITDHINLQGANPLIGANDDDIGVRFPDMSEAYSARLRRMALEAARTLDISLHEGVYAAMLGPSYETPAEIRFLKTIGADLVGMSTVAETIAAHHAGMEVLGLACVTNLAAGLTSGKLVHTDVLATAERVSGTFLKLLSALVPKVAQP